MGHSESKESRERKNSEKIAKQGGIPKHVYNEITGFKKTTDNETYKSSKVNSDDITKDKSEAKKQKYVEKEQTEYEKIENVEGKLESLEKELVILKTQKFSYKPSETQEQLELQLEDQTLSSDEKTKLSKKLEKAIEESKLEQMKNRLNTQKEGCEDIIQKLQALKESIKPYSHSDTIKKMQFQTKRYLFRSDTMKQARKYKDLQESARAYKNAIEIVQVKIDEKFIESKKIIHSKPESNHFFRDFKVGSLYDYSQLAQELHKALQKKEEPEEIYRVLDSLRAEKAAINQLTKAYKTSNDLQQLLKEQLKGAQREYALQLIGTKQSAIGKIPSSPKDFQDLAAYIHTVLTAKDQFTSENIYKALLPLQRNTKLLVELRDTYRDKYNIKEISTYIKNTFKRKHCRSDYVEYLMGEPKMEVEAVSHSQADRLREALSAQEFMTAEGEKAGLPYHTSIIGCHHRTHVNHEAVTELGWSVQKVFAVSVTGPGELQKGNLQPDNSSKPWSYHVALCIDVKNPLSSSDYVKYVIDPSISDQLLTIDEWVNKIKVSQGETQDVSAQDLQTIMATEEQNYPPNKDSYSYPSDETYVFTVKPNEFYSAPQHLSDISNTIGRDRPIANEEVHKIYEEEGINVLTACQKIESYSTFDQNSTFNIQSHKIHESYEIEEIYE